MLQATLQQPPAPPLDDASWHPQATRAFDDRNLAECNQAIHLLERKMQHAGRVVQADSGVYYSHDSPPRDVRLHAAATAMVGRVFRRFSDRRSQFIALLCWVLLIAPALSMVECWGSASCRGTNESYNGTMIFLTGLELNIFNGERVAATNYVYAVFKPRSRDLTVIARIKEYQGSIFFNRTRGVHKVLESHTRGKPYRAWDNDGNLWEIWTEGGISL